MSNASLIASTDPVTSVHRFQSLAPGQYWKARNDHEGQGVEAGETLLIESLKWVEEKVHTVVLRAHPLKYGRDLELFGKRFYRLREHRFLLDDFLALFDYEPEHQKVRAAEVGTLQGRVQELQTELVQGQSNPAVLAGVIAQELDGPGESAPIQEGQEGQEGQEDQEGKPSGAMVDPQALVDVSQASTVGAIGSLTLADAVQGGLSEQGVNELREAAQREHKIATIKANWIQGKTTEIAQTIRAMTPFFEEQAAAALAATEDVRAYVGDLIRGIESLDLYVGKGVTVQTLREGDHAPKDVPLTFVQRKLVMDEELAVWTDLGEWFDFTQDERFVEALRQNDGLVEQIFPTERCILVMATTHRYLDYGHSITTSLMEEKNREVFLLVRDGWNIHRVYSGVESHLKAARLFPSKDEHEAIFRGFDGTKIRFEDLTYADRMAEHELFALHYKRFLILACGLDHRLKLFGDFYEGPASMDFLSMTFQERNCRFLYDDDASTMLSGPTKRADLREWIEEKNKYLQSGSRVLCHWPSLMDPDTAPGACTASRHDAYYWKARPVQSAQVVIAYREKTEICVDADVGDERAKREHFKAKVSLSAKAKSSWGSSSELMPYLCLDAVRPQDLEWFIHDRTSRAHQITYIRLFKMALAFVLEERRQEEAARKELHAAAFAGGLVQDDAQAEDLVDRAVMAWRAAHRGQSLPALQSLADATDKRAWKSLLDQMFSLAGKLSIDWQALGEMARGQGLEPICAAISGKGQCVLYAAPAEGDADNRLVPFAWVRRIVFEQGARKMREISSGWARLAERNASETVQHVWSEELRKAWIERCGNQVFTTPKAKADFFAPIAQWRQVAKAWSEPLDDDSIMGRTSAYESTRRKISTGSKVEEPCVAIPVGAVLMRGQAEYICASASPMELLARKHPHLHETLRQAYASYYEAKAAARRRFDEGVQRTRAWDLTLHGKLGAAMYQAPGYATSNLRQPVDPLFRASVDMANKAFPASRLYWAEDLIDARGDCALDDLLGIERPADYRPTKVRWVHFESLGKMVFDVAASDLNMESIVPLERVAKAFDATSYSSMGGTFATLTEARHWMQWVASRQGHPSDVKLPDPVDVPKTEAAVQRYVLSDAPDGDTA